MKKETIFDTMLSLSDPHVQVLKDLIETAAGSGASDIHIEPKEDSLELRFRVNGVMKLWKSIDPRHSDSIIWRAKWVSGLDLSVVAQPQDGRASFNSLGIDVRVNSMPTLYGSKLVLRILRQKQSFDLRKPGADLESVEKLEIAASKPQGLILITGPTGSGKTTTLYSLLASLDAKGKNISTIEHPVEYRLPGITQVDVGERGMSFALAMRAMLRQDPDVILLGEIRDRETAEIAAQAANTGHLVLSTLHTNSAIQAVGRLEQLGIDEWTLKSSLLLSSAQRLVKKLCDRCKLPAVDVNIAGDIFIANPHGCDHCSKGITGRIPIIEIAGTNELECYFEDKNYKLTEGSLENKAMGLARKGVIDIEEAIKFSR